MANMITTLVRKYHYRGEDFVIVRESKDGVIRAINYKYLDERGVLKQKLNGLQMYCDHERNTVPEIIERINHDLDLRAFFAERRINMADLTKDDVAMITNLERLCEWLDWDSDEEFDDAYDEEDDDEEVII